MSNEKLNSDSDSDLNLDLDSDLNLDLDSDLSIKIDILTLKVDEILDILKKDVSKNTKKMSDHINFVENVYENVKSPLGFICKIVKKYIGIKKYTLHNKTDYFDKLK